MVQQEHSEILQENMRLIAVEHRVYELSNAYLLAKVGFDTAENEPFKAR